MTEPLVAIAYMNWGRWVADCPRPGCANAERFGRDPVTGHVGGLTGTTFRCGTTGNPDTCGLACRAVWPPNVADIERLMMMRPAPATRNWRPGEDLHDLLAENLEHGVLPVTDEPGTVLEIHGDRIVTDALPAGPSRSAIGGH